MKALHNRINRHVLKQRIMQDSTPRATLSFYQYYHLGNPQLFRDHFYLLLSDVDVLGRIYVSYEGVNAQISVPTDRIEDFRSVLSTITFLENIRLNFAIEDDGKSFIKLIIKVRDKIVADGLHDDTFDVTNKGIHLKAEEFNKLADNPETIIIDMRNHYESEVGYFKGAILPDVETFREALPIVEKMLEDKKDKHIIMYCTGGIRCEKSTSLLLQEGFNEVYHLKGGILKYLEETPAEQSMWEGECFVFDGRTAVTHGVEEGLNIKCHACGWPLLPAEAEEASYEHGVSCKYCIDNTTEKQKEGFRMRQSQIAAAKRKRL